MSRTIDTATIAALASDSFNFATLIKFEFDTPIYLTDWYQDVSALSATWASSSHFLGVSNSTESSDLRVNGLSVTLSGVEHSYIVFSFLKIIWMFPPRFIGQFLTTLTLLSVRLFLYLMG